MPVDFKHGLFKVEILVDEQPLTEYDDPDTHPFVWEVTKYIEAVNDKHFKFRITQLKPAPNQIPDVSCEITIDGKTVLNRIFPLKQNHTAIPTEWLLDASFSHQLFRFSALKIDSTIDAPKRPSTVKALKSLGQIQVKMSGGRRGKQIAAVAPLTTRFTLKDKVPEKVLKGSAVSVGINYGPPINRPAAVTVEFEHVEEDPLASFKYNYRSLDALKSLYIVPRTPSPPPSNASRPPSPSIEELREFYRLNQAKRGIKRPRDEPEIKHEPSTERWSPDAAEGDGDLSFVSVRSVKKARFSASNGSRVEIDLTDED